MLVPPRTRRQNTVPWIFLNGIFRWSCENDLTGLLSFSVLPRKMKYGIFRRHTETDSKPVLSFSKLREKVPPNLIYNGMTAPWEGRRRPSYPKRKSWFLKSKLTPKMLYHSTTTFKTLLILFKVVKSRQNTKQFWTHEIIGQGKSLNIQFVKLTAVWVIAMLP
jgi:hypothetical protein